MPLGPYELSPGFLQPPPPLKYMSEPQHQFTLGATGIIYDKNNKVAIYAEFGIIRIGCATVTPEVLQHLLKKYEEHFPERKKTVILQ